MTETVATAKRPINLLEYETAARALLNLSIYDFVAGGAADEVTLRACREAFSRWSLLPRVLRGVEATSTETSVLGQVVAMPIVVAPTSLSRLVHDDGERATARATKTAGTIYTMSTAASISIEEVAPEAGNWWFQLFVFKDRGLTRDLVQRAQAAGAKALVVTVDTPMLGRREADLRNNFSLPPGIGMMNIPLSQSRTESVAPSGSNFSNKVSPVEPALTWTDLEWLASLTSLPVVPKGILHPGDAALAVEHGARALIVSNHGGRQLDGAVAALDALPAVVAAVSDRAEVLVDGGIRRGTDILKALALGARAVLIGRPILWGLAVGGEAGVRHVLDLLEAELSLDLLLSGFRSPAEVNRSLLVPADAPIPIESS